VDASSVAERVADRFLPDQALRDAITFSASRQELLCNLEGRPFSESGFRSNWHRLMQKALAEQVISESFTFHDLRTPGLGSLHVAQARRWGASLSA
jgi:hypothetical protein